MSPVYADDDQAKRRDTLARIAAHLGRPAVHTVLSASILDVSADLAIEFDEGERSRRAHEQADRLDDFDTLMFLMGLPHHEPVPIETLSEEERVMLRRAPRGSVQICCDDVVRLACPPTQSVLAAVYDTDWMRGLRSASVFAPVATRLLIMPALPSDAAIAFAEAAEFGIGVATSCERGVTVHVEPEVWRQHYFTPGGWLFREQVFQMSAQQGVTAPS